jgi:hypothetical protein
VFRASLLKRNQAIQGKRNEEAKKNFADQKPNIHLSNILPHFQRTLLFNEW